MVQLKSWRKAVFHHWLFSTGLSPRLGYPTVFPAFSTVFGCGGKTFSRSDCLNSSPKNTYGLIYYETSRTLHSETLHTLITTRPHKRTNTSLGPKTALRSPLIVGEGGGGGGDHELKLLGVWDSPYVNRVQVVLNLKGVSYEYVEEDVKNKSHLLIASNPVHNKVPVLIHSGKPVCESLVIVYYIDEAFAGAGAGPSLLPSDPYERAVARFWAAYVDDKVGSAWYEILFAANAEDKVAAARRAVAALETLDEAFKGCSKGKAFFAGDGIGLVDVALGGYLGWFVAIKKMVGVKLVDAARTPLLAEWAGRFRAADVVRDVVPDDADKMFEFLHSLISVLRCCVV